MIEKVVNILQNYTEAKEITLASALIDDLGFSSFDLVEIAVEFEEKFQMEIPDSDIKNLFTVGDIVEYLENKIRCLQNLE